MGKFVFILFAMFPFVLFGKETRKVTIESFNPPYREIFYVLKSDSSIRHGSYRLISNGKILVQGYYKTGMKDSLWTQYDEKGKLRFRGFFTEDKRAGIWEFNDDKGEIEQKVDFTNGQIMLYRTQFAGSTFKVFSGQDSIFTLLDRPPLYMGGASRLKEYIASEIRPPLHKANEKALGTVYVECTIDSTGKISNHHILKGIGTSCNIEALRVVRALPELWFPGVLNSKNVTVNYVIPVIFDEGLYKNHPSIVLYGN